MRVTMATDQHIGLIQWAKCCGSERQISARGTFENQQSLRLGGRFEYANGRGVRPGPGPGARLTRKGPVPCALQKVLSKLCLQGQPGRLHAENASQAQ